MHPTIAKVVTVNGRMGTVVLGNGVSLALVIAVINALIGVAVSFGLHLSENQIGSIDLAANALLALWARGMHVAAKQQQDSVPPVHHRAPPKK